jgi:CheY-like chemotaxis protein
MNPKVPKLDGVTVLVVEDHEDTREIFCEMVRFHGGTAIGAGDGKEALARIGETRPQLILCDVHMAGMDGYELLKQLRQDSDLAAIPVIAVTGVAGEPKRIQKAGFDGYLLKPVDLNEVATLLERVFRDTPPSA